PPLPRWLAPPTGGRLPCDLPSPLGTELRGSRLSPALLLAQPVRGLLGASADATVQACAVLAMLEAHPFCVTRWRCLLKVRCPRRGEQPGRPGESGESAPPHAQPFSPPWQYPRRL